MEGSDILTLDDLALYKETPAAGIITDCDFYQRIERYEGRTRAELEADIRRQSRTAILIFASLPTGITQLMAILIAWDREHYLRDLGIRSNIARVLGRKSGA